MAQSKKAISKPTAPVAAVKDIEQAGPFVAFSMKDTATDTEAAAHQAEPVNKDMLRAKAAALRAAAEEIEMIANNAEASSSADAKFAQV